MTDTAIQEALEAAVVGQRYRYVLTGDVVHDATLIELRGQQSIVDDVVPNLSRHYVHRGAGGWIIPWFKVIWFGPVPEAKVEEPETPVADAVAAFLPTLVDGRRYRFALRTGIAFEASFHARTAAALDIYHPYPEEMQWPIEAAVGKRPPDGRGGYIVPLALIASITDVPIAHHREMPKTARQIYRLGMPIPVPTSVDELTAMVIWFGERNHAEHNKLSVKPAHERIGYPTLDCASPVCRMVAALTNERFECPDAWHLTYHGESSGKPGGDCPTCHEHWVATLRS